MNTRQFFGKFYASLARDRYVLSYSVPEDGNVSEDSDVESDHDGLDDLAGMVEDINIGEAENRDRPTASAQLVSDENDSDLSDGDETVEYDASDEQRSLDVHDEENEANDEQMNIVDRPTDDLSVDCELHVTSLWTVSYR